jgi:hypothetical protein
MKQAQAQNPDLARLEQWCVTPLTTSPYTPPECQAHGLAGTVYGHPSRDFFDGDSITTSEVVSVKVNGDDVIATTRSGSQYLLGTVAPEYERQYPNARERLIKSLAA